MFSQHFISHLLVYDPAVKLSLEKKMSFCLLTASGWLSSFSVWGECGGRLSEPQCGVHCATILHSLPTLLIIADSTLQFLRQEEGVIISLT